MTAVGRFGTALAQNASNEGRLSRTEESEEEVDAQIAHPAAVLRGSIPATVGRGATGSALSNDIPSMKMSWKSGRAASATCSMRCASSSARARLAFAEQRHLRAEVGRVADIGNTVERDVRQQPDRHRALGVDVVAEAAAEHELGEVGIVDAHHPLEQHDAGVDRALGELELADVALGEGHVVVLAGVGVPHQHELDSGIDGAQPCRERGGKPLAIGRPQPPHSVDHPCSDHLRAGIDETGSADADRARRSDDAAVNVVVDLHGLHGTHRAPHAVTNLSSFQRRTSRGGAGHEPIPRPHHDLAVGPDVDQSAQFVAFVDPCREHTRHGVRADESGDNRQQAHLRIGRGLERKIACGDDHAVAHRRCIRCQPHVRHVDAQEYVVHAGIADHDNLVDVVAGHAGLGASLPDESVHGIQHLGPQGGKLLRVELRVGDA